MALQINTPLQSRSGFAVPSGSYCWPLTVYGADNSYKIKAKLIFFKDKAAFDAGRSRFTPLEITSDEMEQSFTPAQIGSVTYMDVHNAVKAHLESILGPGTVAIVQ